MSGPVTMSGTEEVNLALDAIVAKVKLAVRSAAVAGGDVLLEDADQRAPGTDGLIAKVRSQTGTRAVVDVGPTKSRWYWRFFETGATRHEIAGNPMLVFEGSDGDIIRTALVRNHPGMAARPFLRPAFDGMMAQALGASGAAFWELLE